MLRPSLFVANALTRSRRGLARGTAARRRALSLVALALCAALFVAACGGGSKDAQVRASTATASAAASLTPFPEASATPSDALPTEVPAAPGGAAGNFTTLKDLVSQFGEPPDSNFARLRIPVLGVDGPVGAQTVGDNAVMTAPLNPVEVTWYDLSAWPGMGGRPGSGGNAIFSGHVDYAYQVPYANNSYYRGKGIFGGLALLSPGDVIDVAYNGQTLHYVVKWRRQMGASNANWADVWSNSVPVDSITLYTCGGDFNFNTHQYSDRIVVRAERAS